jgi:hypothetical protein
VDFTQQNYVTAFLSVSTNLGSCFPPDMDYFHHASGISTHSYFVSLAKRPDMMEDARDMLFQKLSASFNFSVNQSCASDHLPKQGNR